MKKGFLLVLMLVLAFAMAVPANAAVKLNKKKATLYVGDSLKLKVKGAKKAKVKWSSSKKKVAKVSTKGVVKALKPGKANITAKVGNKKLVCKVTVKKAPVTPQQPSPGAAVPQQTPSVPQQTPSVPQTGDPGTGGGGTTPSQPSVTPSQPDPPQETSGSVSDQAQLAQALARGVWKTITLQTGAGSTITVPDGNYGDVELIIDAPNGSVVNNGHFSLIRIRAIANHTFTEYADGNTILFEAAEGRIVVGEVTGTSIAASGSAGGSGGQTLTIVNNTTQDGDCLLTLNANANVIITGSGSAMNVVVTDTAAGSVVDTSCPVNLTGEGAATLNLQDGAQGSTVSVSDSNDIPYVTGIGTVSVTNTSTGETQEIMAVNTGDGTGTGSGETCTLKAVSSELTDLSGVKAWLLPYTGELDDGFTMDSLELVLGREGVSSTRPQYDYFRFEQVPYGNYTLVIRAYDYTIGLHNFTISSSSVSDGTHTESLALVSMRPLMGEDGLFAIADVEGEGDSIVDYTIQADSGIGYLELKGTADELPEFTVIFKESGVESHVIGRDDPEWSALSNEYGWYGSPDVLVWVEKDIYSAFYCVSYTSDFEPEDLLRIRDVSGEQIYSYIDLYEGSCTGSDDRVETLIINTDALNPDPVIRTPGGVRCDLVKENTVIGNESYPHKAVLSIGEEGTDSYHEKTWYIRYQYVTADGSYDNRDLFRIVSVESGNGGDMDAYELTETDYSTSVRIYYDAEECVGNLPVDLTATFEDGDSCEMILDSDPNQLSYPYAHAMLQRGVWQAWVDVTWNDSFAVKGISVNGTALQYFNWSRGFPGDQDPFVTITTDAWDDYPVVEFVTAPGVTYEVSWGTYTTDSAEYAGSFTLNNGNRDVVYGITLSYKNGSQTLDSRIRITNASGDEIDGFEADQYSIWLYCDTGAGEQPTDFTVTLQDGSSQAVTVEPDEYQNSRITVRSGIWSKQFSVYYFDCFTILDVTSEEAGDIGLIWDAYSVHTSNWDHYPALTVNTKLQSMTSQVFWFGDGISDVPAEILEDPQYENHAGVIVLSNGRNHTKKIWLDLYYSNGGSGLESVRITELSGEGVAFWRWEEGTGLHIYYDKENSPLPEQVTVRLTQGDPATADIEPGEVYGDWQAGLMTVQSGIWTIRYDVSLEDSFTLRQSDLHVTGTNYSCMLYDDEMPRRIYVPTASWDTLPDFSVTTYGTTASVDWTAGSGGNEIYREEKGGVLTLTNGTRTETWDLYPQWAADDGTDTVWLQRMGVKTISAPEISDAVQVSGSGVNKQFTLRSLTGDLPALLEVTRSDDQTVSTPLQYKDEEGYRQFYMDVTEGIWKQRYKLSFTLGSVSTAFRINSVQGTNITGYYITYEGYNVILDLYGTNEAIPQDLQISFEKNVVFELAEGENDMGTLTLNDCFKAQIYINCKPGDPPPGAIIPAGTESAGEESGVLGEAEFDELFVSEDELFVSEEEGGFLILSDEEETDEELDVEMDLFNEEEELIADGDEMID